MYQAVSYMDANVKMTLLANWGAVNQSCFPSIFLTISINVHVKYGSNPIRICFISRRIKCLPVNPEGLVNPPCTFVLGMQLLHVHVNHTCIVLDVKLKPISSNLLSTYHYKVMEMVQNQNNYSLRLFIQSVQL